MCSRSSLAVIATVVLAGCASAPDLSEVGSVPDATTFTGLYARMDARIGGFNQKWHTLETTQWHDAEWIAGGGGVSALGVAARSTPAAAVGAAVAGYVAIFDKFYGVDKQNLAWTKASHALQCAQGVSSYINLNTVFLKSIQSPDSAAEDGEAFAYRTLRTAMQQVDRTLEDRLRIGAVSTEPNWSAFQTAVKNAAQQPPAGTKDAPQPDAAGERRINGNKISDADLTKLRTAVGRYKSDIDACLAAN